MTWIPAEIVGQMTGLYSRTNGAVNHAGGVFRFFPVIMSARQGCVPILPQHFKTHMAKILTRVMDQSHGGVPISNTRDTDLVLTDNVAVLVEPLEVLLLALTAQQEDKL